MSVTAEEEQMKICDIRGWGYLTGAGAMHLSDEEGKAVHVANARLIAAAPDMLEALKRVVLFMDSPLCHCGACAAIRAAIAKATGEEALEVTA